MTGTGASGTSGSGSAGARAPGARAAVEWLVSVAPDPDACRWEWERSTTGVALLPAGRRWDVLIIPGRLGYPTLDVLQRLVGRPGPVLADFGDARMGFFVPPGTAARWIGTGVRTAGPGTWIVVPYPGRTTGGVRWLVLPDGTGTLTDPVLLELALHEAAGSLAEGGGERPWRGRPGAAGGRHGVGDDPADGGAGREDGSGSGTGGTGRGGGDAPSAGGSGARRGGGGGGSGGRSAVEAGAGSGDGDGRGGGVGGSGTEVAPATEGGEPPGGGGERAVGGEGGRGGAETDGA